MKIRRFVSFAAALFAYFQPLPRQGISAFLREIASLSPHDCLELAQLLRSVGIEFP